MKLHPCVFWKSLSSETLSKWNWISSTARLCLNLHQHGQDVNTFSVCLLPLILIRLLKSELHCWYRNWCTVLRSTLNEMIMDETPPFCYNPFVNVFQKWYVFHLRNEGLRHNKTIRTMLLFTQALSEYCLRWILHLKI